MSFSATSAVGLALPTDSLFFYLDYAPTSKTNKTHMNYRNSHDGTIIGLDTFVETNLIVSVSSS